MLLLVGTHREIARLETNSNDDSAGDHDENLDFAGGVIRLMQRELAELKEMVRLGAGIPGDEQRIEIIKGVLARWHKVHETFRNSAFKLTRPD
jgi:hypothetical protein